MFVKTQFETMVNVTHYSKITIKWDVKLTDSSDTFHEIVAFSDFLSERGLPNTQARALLAEFPEDKKDQAQQAYDDLYNALFQEKEAFDMTQYTSG